MHRSWWLLVLLCLACGKGSDSDEKSGSAAGSGTAVAPSGPVAKPAPTFCDNQPCPCEQGSLEKARERHQTCDLTKELVVQGVPCGKGRIDFHADGKLKECRLAAPVRVGPYDCQVGVGILYLHPDGSLKRCNVKGTYKVGAFELASRWGSFDLEIYETGALKEGDLAKPTKLGDKTCREDVTLYRDGTPYDCKLDAPFKVDDKLTLPAGTPALFGPDGKLIGYFPQQDMPYEGGVHKAGYPVCLVKECNTIPQ